MTGSSRRLSGPISPIRSGSGEAGAVAVEFVVLLPMLALIIAVVILGARLGLARSSVQQLADSAARQASLSRSAAVALSDAEHLVTVDAAARGLDCAGGAVLELDVSGFERPLGERALTTAVVRCEVPLADLVVPGLPGSVAVEATARSTLDRFRGKG